MMESIRLYNEALLPKQSYPQEVSPIYDNNDDNCHYC